jgi:5-methylcytosine-specific restriction endonuclease McrA
VPTGRGCNFCRVEVHAVNAANKRKRLRADPEAGAKLRKTEAEQTKSRRSTPEARANYAAEHLRYVRNRRENDPTFSEKEREYWKSFHSKRALERDYVELRKRIAHRRRARLRDSCSPGVTAAEWAAICRRYTNSEGVTECAYCPKQGTTIDHVVPIARGGRDAPENVVPACLSCNSSKGARLLSEWQRTFKKAPVMGFENATLQNPEALDLHSRAA